MHTWRKVGCCLVAGVALSASAVTIQVDQVKQRYPWNGIVDIDYTLTYQDGESLPPAPVRCRSVPRCWCCFLPYECHLLFI